MDQILIVIMPLSISSRTASGTHVASFMKCAGDRTTIADGFTFTRKLIRNSRMRKNDSVSHVMTKDVVKLDYNDPVSTARKLFEYSGIHHLPVVK